MADRKVNVPTRSSEAVPKLSEDAKHYVVTSLAMWRGPTEILRVLAEDYGTPISAPGLWHYDPRNPECPKRWRDLHATTRAAFVANVSEIAIANPAWRLKERERLYRHVAEKANPNVPLATEILDQAARDAGGAFGNRLRVEESGPNGGPIEHSVTGQIDHVASCVFGLAAVESDALDAIIAQALGDATAPAKAAAANKPKR